MYTQLEQRGMAEPPVNVGTLSKMKLIDNIVVTI